jgi:hypothetical protein
MFYNAGLGMQEKGVELSLRKKEKKEKNCQSGRAMIF